MQDEQAETSSMASPERATRQRNIPSLSPLNIARQPSPPAPSPSHLASEVACLHDAVMLDATNDLNADGAHSVGVDHSGDSDFDEQHDGDAEYFGQPQQTDVTAARFHNGSVPQGDPCHPLEDLDSSDEAMSEEECEGAAAENSRSTAQAVHHHSPGAGAGAGAEAEAGDAQVDGREEEPSRARQHSASGSASVSASESASLEAEAAAGPSRLPTADMQTQDQAEPMRRHWAAGAHLSSEGEPDSPGGEAELPEEGWMWYTASLLTFLY